MCAINRKIFFDGNVLFFACLYVCVCDFVLQFRRRKTYRTATKTTRSRWMKMTKNGNNKIKSSVRFSALVIIIFSNILGIHFSRRQTMLYGVLQTFLCARWSAFTFISWKSLVLTQTTPTYFYLILFNRESVCVVCHNFTVAVAELLWWFVLFFAFIIIIIKFQNQRESVWRWTTNTTTSTGNDTVDKMRVA